MDNTIDLLQIKIEKAKAQLSDDTSNAINAVDWKAAILELKVKHGYSIEQLGDLELETELLLCGLVSPENYPKELENRMRISKAQANELVNEMNEQVFAKIKTELMKITDRKREFVKTEEKQTQPAPEIRPLGEIKNEENKDKQILSSAGIEILNGNGKETLPVPEKLELEKGEGASILAQKLSSSVQIPSVKTEHTLENITKTSDIPVKPASPVSYPKNADPYRLPPE